MKEFIALIETVLNTGNVYLIAFVLFAFILYILWKSGILTQLKIFITRESSAKKIDKANKQLEDVSKKLAENIIKPIQVLDLDVAKISKQIDALNKEIEDIKDDAINNNIEIYRKYEELIKNVNEMNVQLAVINTLVTNINNINNNPYQQAWGKNPSNH